MTLRGLAGMVAVVFTVTGCAQHSDGSIPNIFSDIGILSGSPGSDSGDEVSPEQQALRTQATRYRNYVKTRLQSAAIGALIGGIGGALSDRNNRARGAALGAAVGGVVGYVGGSYLTRDHSEFVASRETFEKDIKVASELTASSQENVKVAKAALQYQREEIARLNKEFQAGQSAAEGYEHALAQIAQDRESVQSMITVTEERVAKMETSIPSYQQAGYMTAELEQANAAQRRDLDNLRKIEDALVALISGAPEGISRPTVT